MRDFYELKRDHEVVKLRFILMELEIAATFAETALNSDSDEKAARNIANSKRAYTAAAKFLAGTSVTTEMAKTIMQKIERLSALLGEKLPSPQENKVRFSAFPRSVPKGKD